MSQRELDAAVAQATGETLRTIRRRGFSVIDPEEIDFDSEPNSLPPRSSTGTRSQRADRRPRAGAFSSTCLNRVNNSPALSTKAGSKVTA